jgi:hypothetical protein
MYKYLQDFAQEGWDGRCESQNQIRIAPQWWRSTTYTWMRVRVHRMVMTLWMAVEGKTPVKLFPTNEARISRASIIWKQRHLNAFGIGELVVSGQHAKKFNPNPHPFQPHLTSTSTTPSSCLSLHPRQTTPQNKTTIIMAPAPPTVIAIKQNFLTFQTRLLSQPLNPTRVWRTANTNADEGSLPEKAIDDALFKLNHQIAQHSRRVFAPQATRHVAEQIDQLYWNSAVAVTAEDEEGEEEGVGVGADLGLFTSPVPLGEAATWGFVLLTRRHSGRKNDS